MHVLRIMSRNMPKLQACSSAKHPNQYFHIFHFCDLVVGTETGSDRKFSIHCLFDFFFMPQCQFHVLCQFSFLNFSVSFLLTSPFIFFFIYFHFSLSFYFYIFPCYFLFLSALLAFLGFYPLVSRFYLLSTPFSFFLFCFYCLAYILSFLFYSLFFLFTPYYSRF